MPDSAVLEMEMFIGKLHYLIFCVWLSPGLLNEQTASKLILHNLPLASSYQGMGNGCVYSLLATPRKNMQPQLSRRR